jgi:hypothetical protein
MDRRVLVTGGSGSGSDAHIQNSRPKHGNVDEARQLTQEERVVDHWNQHLLEHDTIGGTDQDDGNTQQQHNRVARVEDVEYKRTLDRLHDTAIERRRFSVRFVNNSIIDKKNLSIFVSTHGDE